MMFMLILPGNMYVHVGYNDVHADTSRKLAIIENLQTYIPKKKKKKEYVSSNLEQ